jgi:hypothetical protein
MKQSTEGFEATIAGPYRLKRIALPIICCLLVAITSPVNEALVIRSERAGEAPPVQGSVQSSKS